MNKNFKFAKLNRVKKIKSGFDDEFQIYKKILWPCGLWPMSKLNAFTALWYIIALTSQIFLCTFLIIEIMESYAKVIDMVDYYVFLGVTILLPVKLLFFKMHFAKISNIFFFAQNNWLYVTENDLTKIMKNFATSSKGVYYVLMTVGSVIFMQYTVLPIIFPRNDTSNLPIPTIYVFTDLPVATYYLLYFLESVAIYYNIVIFIGVDLVFCGLVMHLCGQLKILQIQFNKIGQSIHYSSLQQFAVLVQKHCYLISLSEDLKNAFNVILLVFFLISTFLITTQGLAFIVAIKARNLALAIKCTQSVPCLVMLCFLYCYCGQLLEDYFVNINSSIYYSYWYLLSPNMRRCLRFSMMQSDKPVKLTAGKLVHVNINLFLYFMKYLFSFFTVVSMIFKYN